VFGKKPYKIIIYVGYDTSNICLKKTMKVCLEYLCRFMPMNTTANTESKDQKVIRMFNEINQNISQITEINTMLTDRIIVLKND
jgi:hypothetical protein